MNQSETTAPEYRFVSADGKRASRWRPTPHRGILGHHKEKTALGPKYSLEIRERADVRRPDLDEQDEPGGSLRDGWCHDEGEYEDF